MGTFLDAMFAALGDGVGRRRGSHTAAVPASRTYVQPSDWHVAAVAALVVQAAQLVAVGGVLGWVSWLVFADEMLFALAAIVVPIAITAMFMCASALVWMVRLCNRVVARDAGARLEVALCATLGTSVAICLAMLLPGWTTAIVAVPAAVAAAAAIAPSAWRPAPSAPTG